MDAAALHDTVRQRYGDRAYNGATVTTGELDDQLVYSVNRNKTNPDMRRLAEELKYKRVTVKLRPHATDAEQVMLDAVDQGKVGSSGRIATSRPPCDASRQDCSSRISSYPDIGLVGR